MILVTLGTQDKPFTRLLEAIDNEIKKGNIQEEVIVQAGCTKYKSPNMKVLDYIPVNEFADLVSKADLVITHAGVGSILTALKQGKKIIAAARLKEFGEHTNNHQLQLLENFEQEGYLIALKDFDKLGEALEQAKDFTPKPFTSNTKYFISQLEIQIETLLHLSHSKK